MLGRSVTVHEKDTPKRRLPVLQATQDDGEQPPTTPWLGVVVAGVVGAFVFVPLALLAKEIINLVVSRIVPAADPVARAEAYRILAAGDRLKIAAVMFLAPAVALVLAAVVSGLIVGRFGSEEAKREGTITGALLGVMVLAFSLWANGLSGGVLEAIMSGTIILVLAALSGRLGAALGWRWRPDADKPASGPAGGSVP